MLIRKISTKEIIKDKKEYLLSLLHNKIKSFINLSRPCFYRRLSKILNKFCAAIEKKHSKV